MSDDQHEEGTPRSGGRWDPLPQGDYDDGATAFVKLPEGGIDALLAANTPLAAPGHGYVPPQIAATPPDNGAGPTVGDAWSMPPGGAEWPDPNAVPQEAPGDRFTYNPATTQQWDFGETGAAEAAAAPGQDVTGQWSIPVAGGDLPDESGEFTTSSLVEQWGGTPPATLPGGAAAPWATEPAGPPWGQDTPGNGAARPGPAGGAPAGGGAQAPGAPAAAAGPGAAAYTGERQATDGRGFQAERPGTDGRGYPVDRPSETDGRGYPTDPSSETDGRGYPVDRPSETDGRGYPTDPSSETDGRGYPTDRPTTDGRGFQADRSSRTDGHGYPVDRAPDGPHTRPEPDDRATASVPEPEGPVGGAAGAEGAPGAGNAADGVYGAVEAAEGRAEGRVEAVAEPSEEPTDPPAADTAPETVPDTPREPSATSQDEHPPASYVLSVNGVDRPVTDAWIGESLLYVLRERLGLAGAKDGCSQGECGACNVQVDGRLVASCLVPAVTAAGSEVRTVEGLAVDGQPSDVQRALAEHGAVQCGFCVPGMAMTVHDLLEGNPAPTELETRQALSGNLCRCSGYRGVLDAVKEVVAEREAHAAAEADGADGAEGRIPHQAGPGAGGVHHSVFETPGFETPGPAPHDQSYDQDAYGPDAYGQDTYGQDGGQA